MSIHVDVPHRGVLSRRRILILAFASAAIFSTLGLTRGPEGAAEPAAASPTAPAPCFAPQVRLVIDFGDGTQMHYTRVGLHEFVSDNGAYLVLDAMNAAAKQSAGPRAFTFTQRGSGSTAFVTSIAGIANEGGGKEARNWQFWVNDERSKVGVGAARVRPGDRITWALAPYSETAKRPE